MQLALLQVHKIKDPSCENLQKMNLALRAKRGRRKYDEIFMRIILFHAVLERNEREFNNIVSPRSFDVSAPTGRVARARETSPYGSAISARAASLAFKQPMDGSRCVMGT